MEPCECSKVTSILCCPSQSFHKWLTHLISSGTTLPDGSTRRSEFDLLGRKTADIDELGLWTNYTYNSQGQLLSVQLPPLQEPGVSAPVRPTYSYEYDARGNQTKLIDPKGNITTFTFDADGRQTSRQLPDGSTESFWYDDQGRQIRHLTFEGVVETQAYDPDTGRLTEQQFFDNLTAWGAADPHLTESFTYDARGRKIATLRTDHVDATRSRLETWSYDSQNRLRSASSPEGTLHYEYDLYGRLTRKTTGFNPADPDNDERYTYTAFGQLDTVTVYERNNVVLSPVGQAPPAANVQEITDYDYDLQGNLSKITKPNGVIDQYAYDAMNRLTSLVNFAPDSTPNDLSNNPKLAQYDYTYRADGKKLTESDSLWENGIEKDSSYQWTYDENGRLTDEVFSSYDSLLSQSEHFTFDLNGNRLQQTVDQGNDQTVDKSTAYAYDQNDRLLTETTGNESTSYTYDHTEQASKTVTENNSLKTNISFGWDVRGRLTAITQNSYTAGILSRVEKSEYDYNEAHIRTSSKVSIDSTGNGSFDSVLTTRILNEAKNFTGYSQVLQETTTDENGVEQSKTIYTLGLQRINQTTFDSDHITGWSFHFEQDGHGSTRMLLDPTGQLAVVEGVPQIFAYDAGGNLLNMDPHAAATAFLNTGEQFDAITGLQYNRERFTQLHAGRFLGLDPYTGNATNPLSFNKYLFVHSDPVNGIDPTGKFTAGESSFVSGAMNTLHGLGSAALIAARTAAINVIKAMPYSASISAIGWATDVPIRQSIHPIPFAQIQKDRTYALLAKAGYDNENYGAIQAMHWERIETWPENGEYNGFRAVLFKNSITQEYVLSYSGTNDTYDVLSDIRQGLFGNDSQYTQAIATAWDAINNYTNGNSIHFVGHSLGGGLASAAALVTQNHATTFNAAGVNSYTVAPYGVGVGAAEQWIDAYRVQGEFLSSMQNTNPLLGLGSLVFEGPMGIAFGLVSIVGYMMPDGVGKDYWLPATSFDPFNRHKMSDVLAGMSQVIG